MESILTSIKKLLGISEELTHYDPDIIFHINSVFRILKRVGVGPSSGFKIKDGTATWADFMQDSDDIEEVKTYVYLRVKLLFDSESLSSTYIALVKEQIAELEWQLNIECDTASIDEDDEPSAPSAGGTTDYTKLENLPTINGEKLIGNYDEKDPNVTEMTETDVQDLWDQYFTDE